MRAIGYVRVSTAEQAEHGVSIAAQRQAISKWCREKGHTLDKVFSDTGSGGRADNRPGLQDAIKALCYGKRLRGVLVVFSLSRLARSTKDTIAIAERLDRALVDFVSLSEDLDTTSAAGKMLFRLMAVFAEHERDVISERTRAALSYKRDRNERISRHIPYGFRLEDGKMLLPIAQEQGVILGMQRMRAAGWTYAHIAAELTERRIPTKQDRQKWFGATVSTVLKRNGTSP